ncbi:MAG TPA: DivIVA domain-containing protein [Jatrophihabitans sp.]|nr:DivIVA domain-containing protein [Jatrophihabitans sp.]
MTSSRPLTGDEVRRALFAKPPMGKRGYDSRDVDEFMARVAATLDGHGSLTADEVDKVVFRMAGLRDRGYRQDEVDAMLDVVASILRRRAGGGADSPAAGSQNTEPLSGYQIRQTVLPKSPIGTRGYDERQVEEFMERAAHALDGAGLPLAEVQGVNFDRAPGLRRGYRVDAVDALLARITAELRRRGAGW